MQKIVLTLRLDVTRQPPTQIIIKVFIAQSSGRFGENWRSEFYSRLKSVNRRIVWNLNRKIVICSNLFSFFQFKNRKTTLVFFIQLFEKVINKIRLKFVLFTLRVFKYKKTTEKRERR